MTKRALLAEGHDLYLSHLQSGGSLDTKILRSFCSVPHISPAQRLGKGVRKRFSLARLQLQACIVRIAQALTRLVSEICTEDSVRSFETLKCIIQSTLAITEFGITEISIQRKKPADFTKITYK